MALLKHVTKGGGGRSTLSFFKNWKNVPQLFGKMSWLRSSIGEISHWKCQFKSFQEKKSEFFPAETFFLILPMIFHQSAPISRKLPFVGKVLVTCMVLTTALLEKQNQFCKKLINKILWLKRKKLGSFFYQSKLVTFCSYYHCFSKYYTTR